MNSVILRNTIREILLEASDEDLEAKANFSALPKEEQARQLSNVSIYKTLSAEQRTEAAHSLLSVIGLLPVVGEPADLVDAMLYISEERYALAAISLICLIPAVGSVTGAIKLTTKTVPIEAVRAINQNVDVISTVTKRIAKELPATEKVSEAVDEIIRQARFGNEINLDAIGSNIKAAKSAVSPSDVAEAWYKRPGTKEAVLDVTRNSLTRVLNKTTTKEYKVRLIRNLSRKFMKKMRDTLLESEVIEKSGIVSFIMKRNADLVEEVAQALPSLVDKMSKTCKIRIIDDIDLANKLSPPKSGSVTYGRFYSSGNDVHIEIYLPRYPANLSSAQLEAAIEETVLHEIRHAIDYSLAKIFYNRGGGKLLFSQILDMQELFKTISDNIDIAPDRIKYLSDPSEVWVRVDALRDHLGKNAIDLEDLKGFLRSDSKDVPSDLYDWWLHMYKSSDAQLTQIVDAMNKVL
jgi:hypothetical protein